MSIALRAGATRVPIYGVLWGQVAVDCVRVVESDEQRQICARIDRLVRS